MTSVSKDVGRKCQVSGSDKENRNQKFEQVFFCNEILVFLKPMVRAMKYDIFLDD